MEWLNKLNEDQKNNLFVTVFLATVLIFVSWSKGCFETKKITQNIKAQAVVEQVAPAYRLGSTELSLFNFLNDSQSVIDTEKGTWFDFDQVNFESGTAQLTPTSDEQLKNIVTVMNQFPQATFKIGGYTDNTGAEEVNLKISDERAKVVMQKLIDAGAKAETITGSEGYGSQHPVADNTTAEGREKNRRISIRVKSK